MLVPESVFFLAIVLSCVWLTPSLSRAMTLRSLLYDDFGQTIPYHQAQLRRQLNELAVKLLLVAALLVTLANGRIVVDHVNGWATAATVRTE